MDGACLTTFSYLNFTNYSVYIEQIVNCNIKLKNNGFCPLTRPPSYRQSSFRISTLGRYLRNAGKVWWVGIHLAVYCILHDSATTTCSKTHITYITVTVTAPIIQNRTAKVS